MFKPLRDNILIEPLEKPLSSVIHAIQRHEARGVVVAVGPGKELKRGFEPIVVKPGDIVQTGDDEWLKFPQYWEGNKRYLIITQADIVGVEYAS